MSLKESFGVREKSEEQLLSATRAGINARINSVYRNPLDVWVQLFTIKHGELHQPAVDSNGKQVKGQYIKTDKFHDAAYGVTNARGRLASDYFEGDPIPIGGADFKPSMHISTTEPLALLSIDIFEGEERKETKVYGKRVALAPVQSLPARESVGFSMSFAKQPFLETSARPWWVD